MRGNDVIVVPGNPASQPLDMNVKPGSGEIAAVFDVRGACALGPDVVAQLRAGDFSGQWRVLVFSGCPPPSQVPPSVTSSVRRFAGP